MLSRCFIIKKLNPRTENSLFYQALKLGRFFFRTLFKQSLIRQIDEGGESFTVK